MRGVARIGCPAKLNLFLEIFGRRPDGYHELATVMTPIDLADTLEVRPARRFALAVEGPRLEGKNTVEKAFEAVARRRRLPGARVRLRKRIPAGSGLGGGSSDAAGMIEALDAIYDLGLTHDEKLATAAEVGSDVGFFLAGGPALCTGRGEIVSPLARRRRIDAALVCPPFAHPTREVYARLKIPLTPRPKDVIGFLNILAGGDVGALGKALYNGLESAAFDLSPALRFWAGKGFHVTGSGSAMFALCASAREARRVAAASGGSAVCSL